jgi:hypothetical protein
VLTVIPLSFVITLTVILLNVILFIVILNNFILSIVILLNVILLPNILLIVILLNVILLTDILLIVILPISILLIVILLIFIMPIIILKIVTLHIVTDLIGIRLNVNLITVGIVSFNLNGVILSNAKMLNLIFVIVILLNIISHIVFIHADRQSAEYHFAYWHSSQCQGAQR